MARHRRARGLRLPALRASHAAWLALGLAVAGVLALTTRPLNHPSPAAARVAPAVRIASFDRGTTPAPRSTPTPAARAPRRRTSPATRARRQDAISGLARRPRRRDHPAVPSLSPPWSQQAPRRRRVVPRPTDPVMARAAAPAAQVTSTPGAPASPQATATPAVAVAAPATPASTTPAPARHQRAGAPADGTAGTTAGTAGAGGSGTAASTTLTGVAAVEATGQEPAGVPVGVAATSR